MLEEDGVLRKMIDSLFDQSRDDCAAEIEGLHHPETITSL
jgi:hypothetical protein